MVLSFKQQGISIMARPTLMDGALVMVPANIIFSVLVRLPDIDIAALGFGPHNHPCNTILSTVLVLPPVSRPAMRTVNLKTGNPFVPKRLHGSACNRLHPVEDSITTEYQAIIQAATALQNASDRHQLWTKYMELHTNHIFLYVCAYTKVCCQH